VALLLGLAMAAALVWVVVTTLWLWRHQERVVFQPPSILAEAPAPARRVEFRAADGQSLYGYVVSPRAAATHDAIATLVIAFHGNADLAAWLVPWAGELATRAGVTVFVPEYRGYGGIPGAPSYESAASDAKGALAYALDSLRPTHVAVYGHSLGSAMAAEVAMAMHPRRPLALVLQSPFTSAQDMATRMLVPPIPGVWRRISRVHYDTRARVAELDAPVWVAHGTRDVVIPVRMGRQVFEAAQRRGQLLLVEGAGHNDVADVGDERYWRWIVAALSVPIVELEEKRDGRLPGLV
jgi:pimeloyl-ACP methyl ester carboxylesterase